MAAIKNMTDPTAIPMMAALGNTEAPFESGLTSGALGNGGNAEVVVVIVVELGPLLPAWLVNNVSIS
jgi:hypothetical protein